MSETTTTPPSKKIGMKICPLCPHRLTNFWMHQETHDVATSLASLSLQDSPGHQYTNPTDQHGTLMLYDRNQPQQSVFRPNPLPQPSYAWPGKEETQDIDMEEDERAKEPWEPGVMHPQCRQLKTNAKADPENMEVSRACAGEGASGCEQVEAFESVSSDMDAEMSDA